VLYWSTWRRRRQAQAKASHYRKRLKLYEGNDIGLQYYPSYLPTSVTLLSFHAPAGPEGEPPILTIDRHGSLHLDAVPRPGRWAST
jgi:hypothetical protein